MTGGENVKKGGKEQDRLSEKSAGCGGVAGETKRASKLPKESNTEREIGSSTASRVQTAS